MVFLYKDEMEEISEERWQQCLDKVCAIQQYICDQVYLSRKKDYENPYRNATFRNEEEKEAVIGTAESASFVKQIRQETEDFLALVEEIKKR